MLVWRKLAKRGLNIAKDSHKLSEMLNEENRYLIKKIYENQKCSGDCKK